jgi:hypothetical protein
VRVFSYVVARDYGFAPNPFYGFCTLATCKPTIRRAATAGDWVIGTGSKRHGRSGCVVYIMQVSEHLTYNQYWGDPRFENKKPIMVGSRKQAFGDNIYHRPPGTRGWKQANSHHSLPDGRPNPKNIRHDTQTDRVLVAERFAYWGANGPRIPKDFRSFQGYDLCVAGQGHKSNFPPSLVAAFIQWFNSLEEQGYIGPPGEWQLGS